MSVDQCFPHIHAKPVLQVGTALDTLNNVTIKT